MQDRDSLISFLQAFGIVLVVMGHSFYGLPNNPLFSWIYSFHMPLFMFISGFLFRYGFDRRSTSPYDLCLLGWKGFIWKKVKRLLVPYIFISSLAFLPKVLMSRWAARPLELSWAVYGETLLYPGRNTIIFFWFLPTLFLIFFLIAWAAKGWSRVNLPRVACYWWLFPLLLLHLFNPLSGVEILNLSGVVFYVIYFWLGYCCCRYHVERHFPSWIWLPSLVLSIIFMELPSFLGRDILRSLNGIVLSISLGQLYVRYGARFFNHLYGASYAIYLFSWFPQVASQQILFALTGAPWYVGSILALVSGIYLPLGIYHLIIRAKKYAWGRALAFLTGQ